MVRFSLRCSAAESAFAWQDGSISNLMNPMPASSNFQQAIQEAQYSGLVGPNVVRKLSLIHI